MRKHLPLLSPLIVLCLCGLGLSSSASAEEKDKPKKNVQVHELIDSETGKPIANAAGEVFWLWRESDTCTLHRHNQPEFASTNAEGRVQLDSRSVEQFLIPRGHSPADSLEQILALLTNAKAAPVRLRMRKWQALSVSVRDAAGAPAVGVQVLVHPLAEYPEPLSEMLPEFFDTVNSGNGRMKRRELVAECVRGLRLRAGDVAADLVDFGEFRLDLFPDGFRGKTDPDGICVFPALPHCECAVFALAPGYPLAAAYPDLNGTERTLTLTLAKPASPLLRLKLHSAGTAGKARFMISPLLHDRCAASFSWEIDSDGTRTFDITGLEAGIYHLGELGTEDNRTLELAGTGPLEEEFWEGREATTVVEAHIAHPPVYLEPTRLGWRRQGELCWHFEDEFHKHNEFRMQPGRYDFKVGNLPPTSATLLPGTRHQLQSRLELEEFSLSLDPRMAKAFDCPPESLQARLIPATAGLYAGGWNDEQLVQAQPLAQLGTPARRPRLPHRLEVFDGARPDRKAMLSVDLSAAPPGAVVVGSTEVDAHRPVQVTIKPGPKTEGIGVWTQAGFLPSEACTSLRELTPDGVSPGPFTRFNDCRVDEPEPLETRLHVARTGGWIRVQDRQANWSYPYSISIPAGSTDALSIDLSQPGNSVLRVVGVEANTSWRIIALDEGGWAWHSDAIAGNEAEGLRYTMPCRPGKATVWVFRSIWREDKPSDDAVCKFEMDIARGEQELDVRELKFDSHVSGQIEVAISGLADAARNTAAWFEETQWHSRWGTSWQGEFVTVQRIDRSLVSAEVQIGWPVLSSKPAPVRTFRGRFAAGEYRVIPWPGAPESLWRMVSVREGQTTRVEFKLE